MTLRSAFLLTLAAGLTQPAVAAEHVVAAPAAARIAAEPAGNQVAVFAGGCFWGVEGVFSHVPGVLSVLTGYHGGSAGSAKYDRVSEGNTGHAEAVQVIYDPKLIRYDQLLRIFFSVVADPTTLNRQGPDEGTQYRSALVPLSAEQRAVAAAYLAQLSASRLWADPVVTRIEPYRRFVRAEDYHQDFMAKNPQHPYILAWDAAKVAALKRLYPAQYKPGFTRN